MSDLAPVVRVSNTLSGVESHAVPVLAAATGGITQTSDAAICILAIVCIVAVAEIHYVRPVGCALATSHCEAVR
jgi:hypothetical protein